MPLMRGKSHGAVSGNIKELIKSGRKPKQAIAIALAEKRKFSKGGMAPGFDEEGESASMASYGGFDHGMAKGGLVEDQSLEHLGMQDIPHPKKGMSMPSADPIESMKMKKMPSGGLPKNESMVEMGRKTPDDGDRDLNEIRMDGAYYPDEVANPEELGEAQGFAHALRKKAKMAMSPENYAMGGLVEAGPEEDERLHGNHPEDIANHPESEEPQSSMPMKPSASYPDKEPNGMALSEEAKEALRNKKKTRRYGMYDPRNG